LIEVVWTDPAQDDLETIRFYLRQHNPRAAGPLIGALVAAGDRLDHFPLRGRPVPGTGLRELVSSRHYVIRYFIEDEFVVILGIRHTARRPLAP